MIFTASEEKLSGKIIFASEVFMRNKNKKFNIH